MFDKMILKGEINNAKLKAFNLIFKYSLISYVFYDLLITLRSLNQS